MNFIDAAVEDYARAHTRSEDPLLVELAEETRRLLPDAAGMLTGRLAGRALKILASLLGARRALEIGTFTGYSALSIAEGMPTEGKLTTCDIDPEATALAKRFWSRSPHGKKIELRLGAALETIRSLTGSFDLVFIDADKHNYPAYYAAVIDRVRTGGLIVIDNALWSGGVLAPKDADARGIAELNSVIVADARVENVLLTVRDGMNVVRKVAAR